MLVLHLPIISFNSSLVRLGASATSNCVALFEFQFQLGTIGSRYQNNYQRAGNAFQFQLGTIGSFLAIPWIIVYLKFQFQLGTIGRIAASESPMSLHCFNSSLVRLGD